MCVYVHVCASVYLSIYVCMYGMVLYALNRNIDKDNYVSLV